MTIWKVIWKILLFGGCVSIVITAAISPSDHDGRGYLYEQKQPSSHNADSDQTQNYFVSPTNNLQPNPAQKVFARRQTCLEHCLSECQPVFRDDDGVSFFCMKLKPPASSYTEWLSNNLFWPLLVLLLILVSIALYCLCRSCCGCSGNNDEHGPDLQRLNQYHMYGYQFHQQPGFVYSYTGTPTKAMSQQQMQSFFSASSSGSTPIGSHQKQQRQQQQMLSVHNDDELKSEPERVDGDSNANTNRLGNGASNSNSNSKAANEKNKGNNQNNKNAKDDKSDESFQL